MAFEALVALVYDPFGWPGGRPMLLGVVHWTEWPGQVPAWAVLGLSAVVAIVVGIVRFRPGSRAAWWLIAIGVLLFITGDTTYKSLHQLVGYQVPFPSFIDAIYITMYPVLALGLLLLNRARTKGGDRDSLLDAALVTLGIGLLSWIFLIDPNVRASGSLLARLTAAAYPLGDVLLLAMLAHLWSAGGLRNTAGRLLSIGALGTLVSDTIYGFANLHNSWNWHDGNPVDLGWIVFYACWGAAALHPSMRELSRPRAQERTGSSVGLKVLACVSLIAPAVLLAESVEGKPTDAPTIAVISGAMFLIVLSRMTGLVKRQREAADREQALRRAAAELVSATGRQGTYDAAVQSMVSLVTQRAGLREVVILAGGPERPLEVVARSGPRPLGDPVGAAEGAPVDEPDPGFVWRLFAPVGDEEIVILVYTNVEPLPEVQASFDTLGSQVRLALEGEALTEQFHARRSEARFQTLVQNASDVILIAKPDTTLVYETPSMERILGYEPGALDGSPLAAIIHPDDTARALAAFGGAALRPGGSIRSDWRIAHRDGSWRNVEAVVDNLVDEPTVEGIVITLRDVTEQRVLEDELKHQAFHDALSGLANRALFQDRLEQALARAARHQTSLAVLFLDLDDFKLVNDTLGHSAGDELLAGVAERLTSSLRPGDTAARFGGDEFAVLLELIDDIDEACIVADRLIAELRAPMTIADMDVQVHASVGIAVSERGEERPTELLQAADLAMYAAKSHGKGRHEVYRPALQAAMSERLERTTELQRALENGEFVLHYQPIVSLDGAHVVGLEALVRWDHPERGLLPPKDFITLAEETGLIIPLGRWVLEEACLHAKRWQSAGPGRLKMSVNISARQFQHEGLFDDVARALNQSGLDPANLSLEITESVLVQDADAVVARMMDLKLLGVSFAVDDFGTGYSSLSYLKRFPIDVLKVDKAFVDDVGHTDKGSALAEAIVNLGRSLDLATVAEGIEDAQQIHGLRALGCTFGQGYYFSRPASAEDIDRMLEIAADIDDDRVLAPIEKRTSV